MGYIYAHLDHSPSSGGVSGVQEINSITITFLDSTGDPTGKTCTIEGNGTRIFQADSSIPGEYYIALYHNDIQLNNTEGYTFTITNITINEGFSYSSNNKTLNRNIWSWNSYNVLKLNPNNNYYIDFSFHSEQNVVNTYTVTYDANGGSGAPNSQTKTEGESLTLSSTVPTRDGYKFSYWTGSDGDIYYPGSIYSKDADLSLYAEWQVVEVKNITITTSGIDKDKIPTNQSITFKANTNDSTRIHPTYWYIRDNDNDTTVKQSASPNETFTYSFANMGSYTVSATVTGGEEFYVGLEIQVKNLITPDIKVFRTHDTIINSSGTTATVLTTFTLIGQEVGALEFNTSNGNYLYCSTQVEEEDFIKNQNWKISYVMKSNYGIYTYYNGEFGDQFDLSPGSGWTRDEAINGKYLQFGTGLSYTINFTPYYKTTPNLKIFRTHTNPSVTINSPPTITGSVFGELNFNVSGDYFQCSTKINDEALFRKKQTWTMSFPVGALIINGVEYEVSNSYSETQTNQFLINEENLGGNLKFEYGFSPPFDNEYIIDFTLKKATKRGYLYVMDGGVRKYLKVNGKRLYVDLE